MFEVNSIPVQATVLYVKLILFYVHFTPNFVKYVAIDSLIRILTFFRACVSVIVQTNMVFGKSMAILSNILLTIARNSTNLRI